MNINVTEYINVVDKAIELGCRPPDGIAILPKNFDLATAEDELLYASTSSTIWKLWRAAGIPEERIEFDKRSFPYSAEKTVEWLGPVIFVSAAFISENPHLVQIALSIIANYTSDLFRGMTQGRHIRLDIIVEQKGKARCKRVRYEGPPEELSKLPSIISSMIKDEK